ncbi:aminopeptidase P family protein [Empedobacter sp. GD03739]|uniref:aminopeptidase P family protein n=1 Tax=Empedobacter sp. GD03739 TaxID=2975376 RepID=UPI00244CA4D2|nr:aminopeptidase P family protein [Empedobacter sp. GD03739]MDH1603774.1 aminopeptidase P family protein [Empedobacter sp. GD03739]
MEKITDRLSALREVMKQNGVSATIIPGTDPHGSEYLPNRWKERTWISGFNGSAGTAVVTLEKAAVWTDSRYFIQAEDQLKDTTFELMKMRMPETPSINEWIISQLKEGEVVGLNPQMFAHNSFVEMENEFTFNQLAVKSIDLIDLTNKNRDELPQNQFYIYDVKFAGKSASEKISEVRNEMKKANTNVYIMNSLDEIAWLFNIRGNDVNYNPLTISYAAVDTENAYLFIDEAKVTPETKTALANEGITIQPYLAVYDYLKKQNEKSHVLVDGNRVNQSLYEAISTSSTINLIASPVTNLKSVKNEIEQEGFRNAMVKDGVALTKFFMWLEENIDNNINEVTIDEQLKFFRSQQENCKGASFGTICGYADHGAMNHYSASPETAYTLGRKEMLLIDSGAQFLEGTTDITRTLMLGEPTAQQKTDYTLVLKGNIGLSEAIFPVNSRGSLLDVLSRKALWENGFNYGHGTGHGVGHFLCVHEGPQSIRLEENLTPLKAGMVLSNEPGLYRDGEYGIRIENLMIVQPAMSTQFGDFLKFEIITVFPIEKNLIDVNLMTNEEIAWLNNYHQFVFEKISPFLDEKETTWLKEKCEAISK